MSGMLNDKGQSIYYGKVGGCVITGNEDGIKHCSMIDPLRARASRLHHPAAGRLRLDRRGGAGAVLRRRRRQRRRHRARQRLHPAQHHHHDLEPHAPRADAEGRGRAAEPRQRPPRLEGRLPLRLREPRAPGMRRLAAVLPLLALPPAWRRRQDQAFAPRRPTAASRRRLDETRREACIGRSADACMADAGRLQHRRQDRPAPWPRSRASGHAAE